MIASIRRSGRIFLLVLAACLLASFMGVPAHSREPASHSAIAPKEITGNIPSPSAEDPLGRRTPYGTVLGFIKAAERRELDRAAEYLDSQQLPKQGRLLAQQLADVLDAADLREPSRNPEGGGIDSLPSDRENVGVVRTGSGKYEIFLDRVHRGPGPPIWLFSADTLKQVPKIHGELRSGWIERNLTGTILEKQFLGVPLWRIAGILLALPLSFLIAILSTRLIVTAFPGLLRRIVRRPVEFPAERLKWPLNLLIMAGVFYLVSRLDFSAASRLFWAYLAATVATVALTWFCIRLLDDLGGLFGGGRQQRLGSGGVAMARLLDKFSKAIVVFIGLLILSYIAGVNLTALLAGLGIGGIAIALAAQKSLENVFGAMTIISDKPIRVGDFCRAGEFTGTVVDIGLRSTRIKTVERTMVSVPNGLLIGLSLENFSMRDKILFNPRIHLGYETTAEQLRSVVGEIRSALAGHPKVDASTARASVVALREQSIEVEIFAYVPDTSVDAYLTVQEELLLRIMDIVHAEGVKFALPVPDRPPSGPRKAA